MFEIGFSELCMVALVALLVIGPERLPKVARITGLWLGKTKRTLASIKQEINDELQAEELRQALKNKTEVNTIQNLIHDTNQEFKDINKAFEELDTKRSSQAGIKGRDGNG
jgi:sec-independent protein translocase protein TatB